MPRPFRDRNRLWYGGTCKRLSDFVQKPVGVCQLPLVQAKRGNPEFAAQLIRDGYVLNPGLDVRSSLDERHRLVNLALGLDDVSAPEQQFGELGMPLGKYPEADF